MSHDTPSLPDSPYTLPPLSVALTGIGPNPVGIAWAPTAYSGDCPDIRDSFSIAERGAFLAMLKALVAHLEEPA